MMTGVDVVHVPVPRRREFARRCGGDGRGGGVPRLGEPALHLARYPQAPRQ